MASQSHLKYSGVLSGSSSEFQASKSQREGRSKNWPLTALLPPRVLPASTRAVLFRTSGLGSELKIHVLSSTTAWGGSKEPGAYLISPYSMTRVFSTLGRKRRGY
jgi:hypothetical protein